MMIRNERQAIIDGAILCAAGMLWLLIYAGLVSCAKPVTRTDTPLPVAAVGVTPYDMVSPFVCRQTVTDISCMATVEVRFRRGATETTVPRGHQFTFTTPKGQGKGIIWFGCARRELLPRLFHVRQRYGHRRTHRTGEIVGRTEGLCNPVNIDADPRCRHYEQSVRADSQPLAGCDRAGDAEGGRRDRDCVYGRRLHDISR